MMNDSKNKCIGVLTFHNGPNFGGFLQAWHMVNALRELGYKANAINYLHTAHYSNFTRKRKIRNWNELRAAGYWFLKNRGFRGIEKELCIDPFTTNPELVPWEKYDAITVGSDVVWDYQNPSFGHDPAYFGVGSNVEKLPIMSYAASCGPADPNGELPDYVHQGLPRFSAIGVRDEATKLLVENASGLEATPVVDPTWLSADLEIKWEPPKRKYLFAYGVGISRADSLVLKDYCRKRDWQLVTALSPVRYADRVYRSLHPFQWAKLFKNAQATAISGTLHGTLYSIKYQKPFFTINSPMISQKIKYPLARSQQEFRLIERGQLSEKSLRILDADYTPAPTAPVDWINESKSFLQSGVNSMLAMDQHT